MTIQRPLESLLLLALLALSPALRAAEHAADVVIGQEYRIASQALGEERTIYVGKPGNYDHTSDRYPVLVVLDGRNPFFYISAAARFLGANQRIPEMLVVAVANPAQTRSRDLTPVATATQTLRSEPTGGSAVAFRRFVAEELLPWVDSRYRTRPQRVLIGHSHGALFAIDTLLEQPDLFDAYIGISPSLWWDDQRHSRELAQRLTSRNLQGRQLFLTYSGTESVELRSGVLRFLAALEQQKASGLRWHAMELPAETHTSAPLRGVQDGLEFVFEDYWLDDAMALYEIGGTEAVEAFYSRRNQRYGQSQDVGRLAFSGVARSLMEAGRFDELVALAGRYEAFKPPASFHLRIAEGYRQQGRNDRAATYYGLALQADPSLAEARQALAELQRSP